MDASGVQSLPDRSEGPQSLRSYAQIRWYRSRNPSSGQDSCASGAVVDEACYVEDARPEHCRLGLEQPDVVDDELLAPDAYRGLADARVRVLHVRRGLRSW